MRFAKELDSTSMSSALQEVWAEKETTAFDDQRGKRRGEPAEGDANLDVPTTRRQRLEPDPTTERSRGPAARVYRRTGHRARHNRSSPTESLSAVGHAASGDTPVLPLHTPRLAARITNRTAWLLDGVVLHLVATGVLMKG